MAEESSEQKPRDRSFNPRRFNHRRKPQPPSSEIREENQDTPFPAEPEVKPVPQQRTPPAPQQKNPQTPPQRTPPQKNPQIPPQRTPQGRTEYSVVIPLFNEEDSLKELAEQLKSMFVRMGGNYEIIFVDDGSTDNSFKVLRELHFQNKKIKVIRFRRNYGKSAALQVGFQRAQGEFVITMDADLQDDPAEIPGLIKQVKAGFDVVSGWKKKRFDPISKTIPSRFFNFVTGMATGIKIHDFNCGLKAYKRDVVKSVNVYGELHRYIPVLAHWQGFQIGETAVKHHPRKYGKTKFGIGRFFKGFLDLLTIVFTTRYITRPLHLFGGWGLASSAIGFCIGLWLTIEKLVFGAALSNRPLFLVSLIMIILGVQFISMGLLGEMITHTQQTEKEYAIRDLLK